MRWADGFLEVISGFLETVCVDKRFYSSYHEEYLNLGLGSNLEIVFGVLETKGDFFHH